MILFSDFTNTFSVQTAYAPETMLKRIKELEDENKELKVKLLTLENIRSDSKLMKFYTGFVNYETFIALFDYLQPKAEAMKYWNGRNSVGGKHYTCGKKSEHVLSKLDEFVMIMVRLRLGLLLKDLAARFGISESSCSKIFFTTWINFLYFELTAMCQYTSKEKTLETMPKQFHNFPCTCVIIDCTEIFTQRPSSLETQRQTFSNISTITHLNFLLGSAQMVP